MAAPPVPFTGREEARGLLFPKGRGAGNRGGNLGSLIPGRPVAGSTVDPAAPVPKETCSEVFPRQKCTRPKPQGWWSSSPNLSLSGSAQTPQAPSTALAHSSKAFTQTMPDSWHPFLQHRLSPLHPSEPLRCHLLQEAFLGEFSTSLVFPSTRILLQGTPPMLKWVI